MKKAFSLALLLFGMACLSFAAPLKVDPGTGYAVPAAYTFDSVPQAVVPAIAADTVPVSVLTVGLTLALAVVLLVAYRRKAKSPLLRMYRSSLSFLKTFADTYMKRLFAYRAKSPWLKSQGSSDRQMLTA